MRVLILTLVFPPDSVSTARLVGDLASDLAADGCRVTVLTTAPHYNRDREAEARQPLRTRWPVLLRESEYNGVRVLHTVMPRKGRRVLPRLLGWAGFHAVSSLAGLLVAPRPDVILAVSPPLTIGVGAWVLGLRRAPFVYNVQELFPDIAVTLGAVRNQAVIDVLHRLERFVYRRAAVLTAIGPGMAARLREKGVPAERIRIIPNFVDVDRNVPGDRRNAFSAELGLDDAFVVSYAGNLGPAQGLEVVVGAARLLKDEPAIRVLLVGDGVLRGLLERSAREAGCDNCIFLPYQPYSRMTQLYAASDVCLVPQAAATGREAVPSKAYQIMAAGRPIMALTDAGSDLAQLVSSSGCGVVVAPGRPDALAAAVLDAFRNRTAGEQMGKAGRQRAEACYSRRAVCRAYRDLLAEVAQVTA